MSDERAAEGFIEIGKLALLVVAAASHGAILLGPNDDKFYYEMPWEKRAPERIPTWEEWDALQPEAFELAGASRAASDTPPDVETLKTWLGSNRLSEQVSAALWIAKFHYSPRLGKLHRQLSGEAIEILGKVAARITIPPMSATSRTVVCWELLEYLLIKPDNSPDEKGRSVFLKEYEAFFASSGKMDHVVAEEIIKRFHFRERKSVN